MNHRNFKYNRGFIALISSIMLSLILFGLTLRVSGGNFSARTNALSAEFKQISKALSRSCGQSALLRLREEYWYVPEENGDDVAVGEDICIILEVEHSTEDAATHTKEVAILTKGSYRGAHTILKTQVRMTNPAFISASSPLVELLYIAEVYN